MPIPESKRHTFIVRFWRQPREILDMPPEWRGSIIDAAGGQRRYFTTFQELILIMVNHMDLQEADLQVLTRGLSPPKDQEP